MADFYTDTVFCLLLFINDDNLYFSILIAAIFTFGPHIISIILFMFISFTNIEKLSKKLNILNNMII